MVEINPDLIVAVIIILIFAGIIYTFWKKAYMTMTLAIVNFIIFFIWRLSVEGSAIEPIWASPQYRTVLEMLSIRYNYFSDDPLRLYTLITHMYLHFDIMHILSNMIFLVLLGVPFEERVGAKVFICIFFATGITASMIDAGFSLNMYSNSIGQVLGTDPNIFHIGASGAIFGILGAFVALYPRDKVFLPIGFIAMHVPVWVGAAAYGALETILAFANPNDHIGHMVHIMGFLSGAVFATLFSKYITGEEKEYDESKMDFNALKKLATNHELRDLFHKFKDEDEPEIRKAWLEKFIEEASCPNCGEQEPFKLKGHKIKCKCGYNLKF